MNRLERLERLKEMAANEYWASLGPSWDMRAYAEYFPPALVERLLDIVLTLPEAQVELMLRGVV